MVIVFVRIPVIVSVISDGIVVIGQVTGDIFVQQRRG